MYAAQEATWLQRLLQHLQVNLKGTNSDFEGTIAIARNPVSH